MLFALLLASVCAHAHTTKLSSADITLAEHSAEVSLTLNGVDLEAALGIKLAGATARVADVSLRAAKDAITTTSPLARGSRTRQAVFPILLQSLDQLRR
jgi:hypothetical protein